MRACFSLRRACALLLGCWLALSVPSARAQPADAASEPSMRIRLLGTSEPSALTLTLRGGAAQLYASPFDDSPIAALAGGDAVQVRLRGDEVHWRVGDTGLFAHTLRLVPDADATWRVAVTKGQRTVKPRTYAGSLALEVEDDALRLVNTVDMPTYVAGVVASEYGFDDLAGSKAMAVAARTYALQAAGRFGPDYDHVDAVDSQVYHGLGNVTAVARQAAEATRGEVLTHDGALIEATYFSSSGGRTANNEDVWSGKPLPYLRGKDDPYDGDSPYGTWEASLDRDRLLSRLSRRYDFDVRGFQVGERSADGRARTVELIGADGRRHRITGNAFRLFASRQVRGSGLRSTWFDAERRGNRYVFEGRGYGHGVGMNQHGARRMAQQGHDYHEILSFYYTDVQLAEADDLKPLGPLPEVIAAGDAVPTERPPASDAAAVPADTSAQDVPLLGPPADEPVAQTEAAEDEKPSVKDVKDRVGW